MRRAGGRPQALGASETVTGGGKLTRTKHKQGASYSGQGTDAGTDVAGSVRREFSVQVRFSQGDLTQVKSGREALRIYAVLNRVRPTTKLSLAKTDRDLRSFKGAAQWH